jgi:imidazolonepropionase-like amidohydrolase
MHRIEAGLLIPGRGEPVRDGVVVLDGGQVSYAGPASGAPETPGAHTHRAAAVLPGLWDCHGHFMGARSLDLRLLVREPTALRAARCARDLRAALDAGVTSVREVGGLGVHLARAVAEGVLDGPAVYGAGAILSTTGGHGDLHSYPLDWIEALARVDGTFCLADGIPGCLRAVREQLRRGARLIKVCASGGVLSELNDPIHQQFTDAELRAIVQIAALAERPLAAHCHGKPGIMAALQAGVLTIEHGTYLDDECCDAMSGPGLPDSWGRNGSELVHLVKLGMTPLQAIEAATATGPATLGRQAPRSGLLAAGYDADVITVDGDPLADISVLASPDRVTAVWTHGRQVKGAGTAPAARRGAGRRPPCRR